MENIKSFTDLIAWQKGHELVLSIYKTTSMLPGKEKYNVINQLERATLSITNNIAEAFGRQTRKEKTQFFYIALGSIKEVQNMLITCRDLGYIDNSEYEAKMDLSASVSRLLQGLIKANKNQANESLA